VLSSRVWPGIYIKTMDQVIEFEDWFESMGGVGRYVGEQLIVRDGPRVNPGETLICEDGVWTKEFRL